MPAVAEPPKVAPAPAPIASPAPQPSAKPMSEPPVTTPTSPPPEADPFLEQDAEIMGKFKDFEDKTNPKTQPKPDPGAQKEPLKKEEPKPQPKVEPKQTFREPKELRQELDRLKGELTTRNDAYSKMESKLKELETKGQDTTKLVERMTWMEQEIAKRDGQIRRLRKEESPEFIRDFKKPFDDSAEDAASVFNQLQVSETNAEGEVVSQRQANWSKDFSMLFSMDVASARRAAKKMFPEDYDTVMGFYNDLHGQKRKMDRALRREQEQAQELEKQEESTRLQRDEQIKTLRERVFKDIGTSVEDYHDPADDKDMADARARGFQLFDLQPRTLEEAVKKEAHIKHRFASYLPHKLQIARLKQQLADKDKELSELKEPAPPGKTKRTGGDNGTKPEKSWEEDFLESVKNA